MKNIRNRVTIPVNFTARKSIKSEVAKVLYNRVDSLLAKMERHEKTAKKLVEELKLKASRYQYKSQRKALLELLQRNLDNIPLSTVSAFLCVEVQETSDKQDWKCVFTKRKDQQTQKRKYPPIINADKNFRDYLIDLIVDTIGGRKQNYALYNCFALHYSENLIRRAIGEYKELNAP